MGDQNIFHLNAGTELDLTKDRFDDESVLIVSARLDAISLFDQLEVGFDSPSLGIVTLLAAAEILNKDDKFKGMYTLNLLGSPQNIRFNRVNAI